MVVALSAVVLVLVVLESGDITAAAWELDHLEMYTTEPLRPWY